MPDKDAIEVEIIPPATDGAKHQAVVRDRGRNRAWSGEGDTSSEAATEATRNFIVDRRAPEYMEK
jgi:hypothetical protein